eukprot:scaffold91673_cov32-Tisochrysis_lutea.AAC.2
MQVAWLAEWLWRSRFGCSFARTSAREKRRCGRINRRQLNRCNFHSAYRPICASSLGGVEIMSCGLSCDGAHIRGIRRQLQLDVIGARSDFSRRRLADKSVMCSVPRSDRRYTS